MCACMSEQRGMFVRQGTRAAAATAAAEVECCSRVSGALFPSTEASLGCQSLGNVSEKLDTFRPQRERADR